MAFTNCASFLTKFRQDIPASLKVCMAVLVVWLKFISFCPFVPSINKNEAMIMWVFHPVQNRLTQILLKDGGRLTGVDDAIPAPPS
jgi:hypothetical protein